MTPALKWHPPVDPPTAPPPDLHAATHRSRIALTQVLADPNDEQAWTGLTDQYDEMAAEWTDWADEQPWYTAPVTAGLAHANPADLIVELSCGTGQATSVLAAIGAQVIATDVNAAMLERATPRPNTRYVRVDVRQLPFPDRSVPLIVGLNAIPHLGEINRVIATGGQLLWCTSFGPGTPLYIEPTWLLHLLGPHWHGEGGNAGHGEWTLYTRP
jgi:SAM-dependent methyltransferase